MEFVLKHSPEGQLLLTMPDGVTKAIRKVYVDNSAKASNMLTFKCSDGSEITLSYVP